MGRREVDKLIKVLEGRNRSLVKGGKLGGEAKQDKNAKAASTLFRTRMMPPCVAVVPAQQISILLCTCIPYRFPPGCLGSQPGRLPSTQTGRRGEKLPSS